MTGLPVVWSDTERWGIAIVDAGKDHFPQNLTCVVKKAGPPVDNGGNI